MNNDSNNGTQSSQRPLPLVQLQAEVRDWSQRNFGKQPTYRPLLGIGEELGELLDAHNSLEYDRLPLGTRDATWLKIEDAIGDAVIYVADYVARMNMRLEVVAAGAHPAIIPSDQLSLTALVQAIHHPRAFRYRVLHSRTDSLLHALAGLGRVHHGHLKLEQGIRGSDAEHHTEIMEGLSRVLWYLACYCHEAEINMQRAVERTWAHVKARNWKSDPKTGGTGTDPDTAPIVPVIPFTVQPPDNTHLYPTVDELEKLRRFEEEQKRGGAPELPILQPPPAEPPVRLPERPQ